PANLTGLSLKGGIAADTSIFSQGADIISGGTGTDSVQRRAGDDTFIWNPGDSSDIVEGQGGFDSLIVNCANIGEIITMSANGPRFWLTRNIGSVTMDVNDVERVDLNSLGGADSIIVNS